MNSKLEQAVHLLKKQKYSCVILIEGKEPECSNEIGIKPLMTKLRGDMHFFENGVIADKVVGKAAALMAVLGGAQAVYGEVMSESAKGVLEEHDVEYSYHTLVPYIENRTKTGRCPLEESVVNVENPKEAFGILEKTIEGLMRKGSAK